MPIYIIRSLSFIKSTVVDVFVTYSCHRDNNNNQLFFFLQVVWSQLTLHYWLIEKESCRSTPKQTPVWNTHTFPIKTSDCENIIHLTIIFYSLLSMRKITCSIGVQLTPREKTHVTFVGNMSIYKFIKTKENLLLVFLTMLKCFDRESKVMHLIRLKYILAVREVLVYWLKGNYY